MKDDNRINLLHLWSAHHPRDFIKRVEDLLTDLYERVEVLEYDVHHMEGKVQRMSKKHE